MSKTTLLTSLLLFPILLASAAPRAGWTRSTRPIAPPSAPPLQLSLPHGRGAVDRGAVARAAVGQYQSALSAGVSRSEAVGLLVQGAYSAQHQQTLRATAAQYEASRPPGEAPWPLTVDKVAHWLAGKQADAVAARQTRAADYYSGALSDLLSAARLRQEEALSDVDRRRLAQICVTLSHATPQTERRQATHLTDVALEVMDRQVARLPWARQVLTLARVTLAGKLRSGPVASLHWEDVTEAVDASGQPYMLLRFAWEKTERNRSARLRLDPDPRLCAVTAVRAWRDETAGERAGRGAAAGAGGGLAVVERGRGVVFPHLDPRTAERDWTRPMTQAQFSSRLQALARAAGLPNPELYTGHAGRSGGATRALLQGDSEGEVMRQGRWRSRSSFSKYDRTDRDREVRSGIEPLLHRAHVAAAAAAASAHRPSPLGASQSGAPFESGPAPSERIGPAAGPVRALDMSDDGEASEEAHPQSHIDSGGASGSSSSGEEDDPSLAEDVSADAARRAQEAWWEQHGVAEEWRGKPWIPSPMPDGPRPKRLVRMVKEAKREALAAQEAKAGAAAEDAGAKRRRRR